ncbi:HD domain-containing protein [Herbaspirillum sp. RV1423]|uniref:HD domain-containing protein n=1 Tax=Herbaspirillum sp. RV1423 TaxID=1443993 RepID=UPI0004B0AD14|nr:HD domain-containing protein [Herbaspirillum sp. RV1423]
MNHLLQDWQTQLATLAGKLAGDDGAHDLNHLHRVWRAAQTLLDEHPQADALTVLAACYLHDLVNLPKNHPQRHLASRQAAQLACRHLEQLRFPQEKLAPVAHAIEAHSFSAGITPTTIEAQIVQDADRLDALGAVGLARLFYTAGRMGSRLAHDGDVCATQRSPDDQRYALDHIACKLETLPATMQTAAGRKLGERRMQWLREFRDTFAAEWEDPVA